MELLYLAVGVALGGAAGFAIAWLLSRAKLARLEGAAEHSKVTEDELRSTFKALAADVLSQNSDDFAKRITQHLEKHQSETKGQLELHKETVKNLMAPLKESLEKYSQEVKLIENRRLETEGALGKEIQMLGEVHRQLRAETGNLVQALRKPQVRGSWGELALRRAVELAGLVRGQHFEEQVSTNTEEGRLRPDLIVYLPGGKQIVVDSKVPMEAYLAAIEAPDETSKTQHLKDHARQLKTHIQKLSAKSYWEQFDNSLELVVLFLPNEALYSAALDQDPTLIELGPQGGVFVATPTTLITLLRAVHYGWRQEKIAENAQKISALGQDLHERLATVGEHFAKVGMAMGRSVDAYNEAIASLERRVLVSARKFEELGAGSKKEIKELSPVENKPRQPVTEE